MSFDVDGYALEAGGGEHVWAFNSLMSFKAARSSSRRVAAEMGRPAEQPVLPDPAPFDQGFVERLMAVAPRYGLEFFLGPPPG